MAFRTHSHRITLQLQPVLHTFCGGSRPHNQTKPNTHKNEMNKNSFSLALSLSASLGLFGRDKTKHTDTRLRLLFARLLTFNVSMFCSPPCCCCCFLLLWRFISFYLVRLLALGVVVVTATADMLPLWSDWFVERRETPRKEKEREKERKEKKHEPMPLVLCAIIMYKRVVQTWKKDEIK